VAEIRIATFNVENLLRRFDFVRFGQLVREPALEILGVEEDPDDVLRKALKVTLTDDSRQQTAQAIRDTQADLVCLQEIDDSRVLDDFHDLYLERSAGVRYGWRRLLTGNDVRGIDVAAMCKRRIVVDSHRELTYEELDLFNDELEELGETPGSRIFRRDVLEVTTRVGQRQLVVFVCHFKSMAGGREETMPLRIAEATAVRRVVERRFDDPAEAAWLIVGDLNDYTHDENGDPIESGLDPLFEGGFCENLVEKLPAAERWTHYFPAERSKHQLDYLLASPALAQRNPDAQPEIVRRGQPWRVPGLDDLPRYPRVGYDRPKASDHCPVAVTLEI
jgi:endonuclease/exonuclease/phosphatase family metal-dependent hydrolase